MAWETEDINEALKLVGGYKRWHLSLFILLSLSLSMATCWQLIAFVFIGWEPGHHCKVQAGKLINESIPLETDGSFSSCYEYVNINGSLSNETRVCSNGWTYDTDGEVTIVTEWDLVCDKRFYSEIAQALFPVGIFLGALVCNFLQDKYGRKWVHISCHVGIAIFGTGLALTQSYVTFVILRMFVGALSLPTTQSGVIILMEMWDSERRGIVGTGLEYMWLTLYIVLAGFVYLLRNWRYLQTIISLCHGIWVTYIWILPESVMWLAAKGRIVEAEDILNKMAKWNGVKVKPGDIALSNYSQDHTRQIMLEDFKTEHVHDFTSGTKGEQPGFKHLFTDSKLRIQIFIVGLMFFTNVLVYYGLIQSTTGIGGDRYINFLLTALMELPGYLAASLLITRFGRRILIFAFHTITAVPLAIMAFIPTQTEGGTDLTALHITLALVGKLGTTAAFAIVFVYMRELFPTVVRGTSIGVCNICGTSALIAVSYVSYLAKVSPWIPNLLFAVISLTTGVLTLVLPETKGLPLPQTINDIHNMWKTRSFKLVRKYCVDEDRTDSTEHE